MILLGLIVVLASACTKPESQLASEALQRGLEAHRAGSLDEATANYRTALLHDPANVLAYYNLGVLDHEQGRLFEAENHYRLALSHDPDYTPALYNLATLRQDLGWAAEAVDLWRRYVALRTGDASAHLRMSRALTSLGLHDEAAQQLEIARALDPGISPPASAEPSSSPSSAPVPSPSSAPVPSPSP